MCTRVCAIIHACLFSKLLILNVYAPGMHTNLKKNHAEVLTNNLISAK